MHLASSEKYMILQMKYFFMYMSICFIMKKYVSPLLFIAMTFFSGILYPW